MSDVNTPSAPGVRQSLALRLCLWAGIVGPIFFVLVFTIDGLLTPGYSATREVVSYLELGPSGWIQATNFFVSGLLFILFALGFFRWMRPLLTSGWRQVTTALLVLVGVGLILASLFFPDAPGTAQTSVHAILHTLAFTLVFLPLGLACFALGGKFISTPGWRIHGVYSLLSGLIPTFAALGNLISLFTPAAPETPFSAPAPWLQIGGLINRVLVILAFAWYVILAIRLLTLVREGAKALSSDDSMPS